MIEHIPENAYTSSEIKYLIEKINYSQKKFEEHYPALKKIFVNKHKDHLKSKEHLSQVPKFDEAYFESSASIFHPTIFEFETLIIDYKRLIERSLKEYFVLSKEDDALKIIKDDGLSGFFDVLERNPQLISNEKLRSALLRDWGNWIRQLNSLRAKSIHYRPTNKGKFKSKIIHPEFPSGVGVEVSSAAFFINLNGHEVELEEYLEELMEHFVEFYSYFFKDRISP